MKNRTILFTIASLCFVLTGCAAPETDTPSSAAPADKKAPNILFIAVDDLNDWISPYKGHPQAITPNLQRLADQGTRFTNAHCQAPLCGPSRASVFTGLLPSTSGIYMHVKDHQILEYNGAKTPPKFFTHVLKEAGYKTIGAGKLLHAGAGGGLLEEFVGFNGFGPYPPKPLNYDKPRTSTDWGAFPERNEEMPDHKVANYGVEQLDKAHDAPFFLALGFNRPHVPWHVPQEWFDLYDLETLELPPYLASDWDDIPAIAARITEGTPVPDVKWLTENKQWKKAVQGYLACITYVDYEIGRVLDALERSGHADNTIVILWSDHGYHLGEKDVFTKMTLWEESSRVPFIMAGPGISKNAVEDRPIGLIDIYPTLLELAGIESDPALDGHSLVPLLADPDATWDHPAITIWGRNNTSVRDSRYRYIRYEDGSEELYDHQTDPNEFQNLADSAALAEVKARLASHVPENQAAYQPTNKHYWNDYWDNKTAEARKGTPFEGVR